MVQPQEDSASLDVSDISVSCQQYTGLYSKTESWTTRGGWGEKSGAEKKCEKVWWKCQIQQKQLLFDLLNIALPFIRLYTAHPNKKK